LKIFHQLFLGQDIFFSNICKNSKNFFSKNSVYRCLKQSPKHSFFRAKSETLNLKMSKNRNKMIGFTPMGKRSIAHEINTLTDKRSNHYLIRQRLLCGKCMNTKVFFPKSFCERALSIPNSKLLMHSFQILVSEAPPRPSADTPLRNKHITTFVYDIWLSCEKGFDDQIRLTSGQANDQPKLHLFPIAFHKTQPD
jgi:hypothetical protein